MPSLERRVAVALVALGLCQGLGLLAAVWRFTMDDTWITLRYSRNLAEGHGWVWNPGDAPLEAYSNFLQVLVGVVGERLGNPMAALDTVDLVGWAATGPLAWLLARFWLRPLGAALATSLVLASPSLALWGVSGLETAPYTALVLGTVVTVLFAAGCGPVPDTKGEPGDGRGPNASLGLLAGLLGLGCALCRPEGALVPLLLALAIALDGRIRNGPVAGLLARMLGMFAIPYCAYSLWRVATFGRLLPAAVACKAGQSVGDPTEIWAGFFEAAGLPLLLGVLEMARRRDLPSLAVGAVLLGMLPVFYGADPIVSIWNRYLVAVWALTLPVSIAGCLAAGRALLRPRGVYGELLVVAGLALLSVRDTIAHAAAGYVVAENYAARTRTREQLADWLKDRIGDETYVVSDSGIVAYRAGGRHLDAFCLTYGPASLPPLLGNPDAFARHILDVDPKYVVVSSHSEELEPVPYYGIFPALLVDPSFEKRYRSVARFDPPPGTQDIGDESRFYYTVFERR